MAEILYERGGMPLFAAVLYDSIDEARGVPIGDLEILQDSKSGVVYNKKFSQEKMQYATKNYDAGKQNSAVFKNVLLEILEVIKRHFSGKKILEIGCGDGYFLEMLEANGFDIKGMDPSYSGTSALIEKKYYTKDSKQKYDGIILRHVLEHIKDYYGFLQNIAVANNHSGIVYIEVPNLDFSNNHFGIIDFYYEHVNYFRLENLESLFDKVIESGYVFGGEYIYIVAKLSSLKMPCKKSDFVINKKVDSNIANIASEIMKSEAISTQDSIIYNAVLWGGGGLRGSTFAIILDKMGIKINHFVDINPLKQGKFIPLIAQNIDGKEYGKIESFETIKSNLNENSLIIILNSAYKDEIMAITKNKYRYICLS